MKICSLLPGATEVIAALGLADDLVGISHECDYPPAITHKPVLVRATIDGDRLQLRGEGLLRVDSLLPPFFLPEHRSTDRYT